MHFFRQYGNINKWLLQHFLVQRFLLLQHLMRHAAREIGVLFNSTFYCYLYICGLFSSQKKKSRACFLSFGPPVSPDVDAVVGAHVQQAIFYAQQGTFHTPTTFQCITRDSETQFFSAFESMKFFLTAFSCFGHLTSRLYRCWRWRGSCVVCCRRCCRDCTSHPPFRSCRGAKCQLSCHVW
jgi:hypothetical protein